MLEILKEKNKGKIVIIKLGAFYIATEEDAVLLNKILKLKNTCLEKNCKVGFPVNSLNKYIEKLNELEYGYIVYNYDSKENRLTQILRKEGKIKTIQ